MDFLYWFFPVFYQGFSERFLLGFILGFLLALSHKFFLENLWHQGVLPEYLKSFIWDSIRDFFVNDHGFPLDFLQRILWEVHLGYRQGFLLEYNHEWILPRSLPWSFFSEISSKIPSGLLKGHLEFFPGFYSNFSKDSLRDSLVDCFN